MPTPDHYATLGVGPAATADEIKRAYRKLARKFHPDVSKEADAETKFKDLNAANEVLSDPALRAAYDETAAQRKAAAQQPGRKRRSAASADFDHQADDFLAALLRRQSGGQRGQHAPVAVAGDDQHATLAISLHDAYHGASRSISLQLPVADAQGRRRLQQRQLDVRIPVGMLAGQQLRLVGQGSPGWAGGAPGDLYLEMAFEPDARFRVSGRDVSFDVPLAPWEAALGGAVEIDAPDGQLALTVPAGSAPGRQLRLKGRGIPGQPPGDLYAVLVVSWPPADTSAAQQAYQALQAAFPAFQARPAST